MKGAWLAGLHTRTLCVCSVLCACMCVCYMGGDTPVYTANCASARSAKKVVVAIEAREGGKRGGGGGGETEAAPVVGREGSRKEETLVGGARVSVGVGLTYARGRRGFFGISRARSCGRDAGAL